MPIYEFYCRQCHTVMQFLSRRPAPTARPDCPRCGAGPLDRQVSRFAVTRGRAGGAGEDPAAEEGPLAGVDEDRLEQAMMSLAAEAEGIDDSDPRQAARLMRKLYDTTGLPLGSAMEEAIRRMEAGEDPEQVEAQMGDLLEQEDPFGDGAVVEGGGKSLRRRFRPPGRDERLYELEGPTAGDP